MAHPDPFDDGDEVVSAEEFRKHPLQRKNPFLRPDPDSYRYDRLRADETPYEELERRGAVYRGEYVDVRSTFPDDMDDRGPTDLQGYAEIEHMAPWTPVQEVRISELEPTSSAEDVGTKYGRYRFPNYYRQEVEHRERLQESCPIDVYASAISPRWGWRWKLMSYYEARPGAAQSAKKVIVDSGVNRWGSPDDVIEAARNVDADLIFASDVTGMEDPSNRGHNNSMPEVGDPGIETQFDAAIEGIRRSIESVDEIDKLDSLILPIQPDYGEFLEAVEDRGWLDEVDHIAVGGLLDVADVHERIATLHTVREWVGEDMNVHALAPGTDVEMIYHLRDHPDLVDSIDVSTPERAVANNKIPDASWGGQNKHLFPYGSDISTVRGAFATGIALPDGCYLPGLRLIFPPSTQKSMLPSRTTSIPSSRSISSPLVSWTCLALVFVNSRSKAFRVRTSPESSLG